MQPHTLLNNRYQLEKQLSHKAGRQTFLAHDLETNTPVIAKILTFDQTFQWDEFKLFEREVKTLQNLNHPAIPKYLDYLELEQDNTHYFALIQTYIDAPSLENLIQEGRKFTEDEVKQLAEKILNILIYLHELNPPVTHRDIKPSNILLNNRSAHSIGDIYLVDFGAVQTVASKQSGTITIVGSYGYIPLEQFSGQATPASDLYSLGMTLIYLLTGVHPADLPQENGQVKFNNKSISPPLVRWLEKMTHPFLNKRFTCVTNALNNLNSNNISKGYHLNLKPSYSQVILNCDGDKLEIAIKEEMSYFMGFQETIKRQILLLFISIVISPIFSSEVVKYFLIIAICIPIIAFIIREVFSLTTNSSTIISIKKDDKITLGYKFFNCMKWNQKSSATKNINFIAYNPKYKFGRFLHDSTKKHYQRGNITVPPSLSVYVGNQEFKIGNSRLSQAEYWWLAQELSEFLNVKIQVIHQPKLYKKIFH